MFEVNDKVRVLSIGGNKNHPWVTERDFYVIREVEVQGPYPIYLHDGTNMGRAVRYDEIELVNADPNTTFKHYADVLQRIYDERTAGDYTFSGVLAEFFHAMNEAN